MARPTAIGRRNSPRSMVPARHRRASDTPADASGLEGPVELLHFGAACYVLGLVSGAVAIRWLVDRGLFSGRA